MNGGEATAPAIDGFEYLSILGSGGFSDVYMYRQKLPRRKVAIKVLRVGSLDTPSRRQFVAEANLMAQLSSHPAIATIFAASISAEDLPYIVLEYCSGGSLGTTYRLHPLSVPEVLEIGVRVASALESAHRLGIIHRDLKPANILITDYGAAVLTDFGISVGDDGVAEATMFRDATSTADSATNGASTLGLSIPWAPPEAFDDFPVSDERSDIYSLGATLFSLLEGRTPFEIAGGSNGALQLSRRITSGQIVAATRDDVAESLSNILNRAMAVDPSDRIATALEFGEHLREVQVELGLTPTAIELLQVSAGIEEATSPTSGVVELVPLVEPPAPAAQETVLRAPAVPTIEPTRPRTARSADPAGTTVIRPSNPEAQPRPPVHVRRPKRAAIVALIASVVVVSTVVVVTVALMRAPSGKDLGAGSPECNPTQSGTASDSVKVSGAFGTAPKVTVPAPIGDVKTTQRTVLIRGNGAIAVKGDQGMVDFAIYDGTTGKELTTTGFDGEPMPITMDPTKSLPGIVKTLECSHVGTRVVGVIPPADAYKSSGSSSLGIGAKDDIVFVADVVSVTEAAAMNPCKPKDIEVVGLTDAANYDPGVDPVFYFKLTNEGSKECTFSYGSNEQEYVISSGANRIWSSNDCQTNTPGQTEILGPGESISGAPFTWNRKLSDPAVTCSANAPNAVAHGAAYHLTVTVDGIGSSGANSPVFVLN